MQPQTEKRTRLQNALHYGISDTSKLTIVAKKDDAETLLQAVFPLGLLDTFCATMPTLTTHDKHGKALILPVSTASGRDTYRFIFVWLLACQKAKKELPYLFSANNGARYFQAPRVYICAKNLQIEALVNQTRRRMTELEENQSYIADIRRVYQTAPLRPEIRNRIGAAVVRDMRDKRLGDKEAQVYIWRTEIKEFEEDVRRFEETPDQTSQ